MTYLRLKEISHIDKHTLSENTDGDFQFDYISLSDVKNGRISDSLPRYKFSESPSRARKKIHSNDILMASVRPNLEGFAQVKYKDTSDKIASTGFSVISAKDGYSSHYIYQYLFSHHIRSQVYALVVGSNYPAITTKGVNNLKIYTPPLSEQKAIASTLELWDTAIEKTERLIAAQKQQFKWLQYKIFFDSQNQYSNSYLIDLCDIKTGKKDVNTGNPNGKYPFFTCAKEHTYSDNYSHDMEAILIAGNGYIGNPILFKGKFEAYQRTYILHNFKSIEPRYLAYFMKRNFHIKINKEKQQGAMPYIKLETLQSQKVLIPPIKEQINIANILNTAQKEITALQNLAKKYRTQKRGLMQKLLTDNTRGKTS